MLLPYKLDLELRRSALDHILAQVQAVPVEDDPFPHFAIQPFFPDDVYPTLLKGLPPDDVYEPFGYDKHQTRDGQSNRKRFRMENNWLERLPDPHKTFWLTIRSVLGSHELKRAVFTKFADALAYRFRCHPDATADLDGYALPELFQEAEGYRIKPHPDTRKKVVTMQISLATHTGQKDLGTEFYRRSLHPARWLREPKGFEIVKRMPFLPNAAYAFPVLNTIRIKSWHGRSSLAPGCGVRNSVLNIWYLDPDHANRDLIEERRFFERE